MADHPWQSTLFAKVGCNGVVHGRYVQRCGPPKKGRARPIKQRLIPLGDAMFLKKFFVSSNMYGKMYGRERQILSLSIIW